MDAPSAHVDADHPIVEPDRDQIAIFLDVVFGYCDGWIPLRGLAEQGTASAPGPRMTWIHTSGDLKQDAFAFARRAARDGVAFYVVPGTVTKEGAARAADVQQMQTVLVDLDAGDIAAKLTHLVRYLGQPTMIVESGGITPEGHDKLHVWWRLSEAAQGEDLQRVCRLREEIAAKVGGDRHFASAHQPIRVAGSIYHKHGVHKLVRIREHSAIDADLDEFAARVAEMPALDDRSSNQPAAPGKPTVDQVLTTLVREGAQDDWTRFQGASVAMGHFIYLAHQGRISIEEGWERICGYNATMLQPSWPLQDLRSEYDRLWKKHVKLHGPPVLFVAPADRPRTLTSYTLGQLLDDKSPMPADIIAPRILTPGGLLVLGGAPKVGKSDFLISWLCHMAAGAPFLGFSPARPLRVFYLQAEIQYHYLRERVTRIALEPEMIAAARDNLVATPRLDMLLNEAGVLSVVEVIRAGFPDEPPDIICVDPLRNLFDGGAPGATENDNNAMMFFLKERIERLRDAVNPHAGIILAHHTRKASKQDVQDDPFLALSGASALRGFYSTGLLMHRPDETSTVRRLEIELRNGPGIPAKSIDNVFGHWIELNGSYQRLARDEVGNRLDAERNRKADVIVSLIMQEAEARRLYTSTQFCDAFENSRGLGSMHTIRNRLQVLATKGVIKYLRDGTAFGLSVVRSRAGYLVVEGMRFGKDEIDPETGEVVSTAVPVLPSHYLTATDGMIREVEDPAVWVYPEGIDD
jgi:hypothetical protein